jgi:hypothetical protein
MSAIVEALSILYCQSYSAVAKLKSIKNIKHPLSVEVSISKISSQRYDDDVKLPKN